MTSSKNLREQRGIVRYYTLPTMLRSGEEGTLAGRRTDDSPLGNSFYGDGS